MVKINNRKLHDFTPRKIIYITIIVFVVGAISYGIFHFYEQKKSSENKNKKLADVSYVEDNINDNDYIYLDSDNDGAYDWVENLWPELDPNNPDSDGDGVLDGKYIKQKREILEKERRGTLNIESNLTESEKLGRSLYTALSILKNDVDGDISEEDKDKISDNITRYISDLSLNNKLFLREDLNIVSDTKENSFLYRDKMKDFFKRYQINTSEIELIIEATKNPENFKLELTEASKKYDKYVSELSKMEVPGVIAGRHTELLNAANQLNGAIKNLILETPDDIVSLSAIIQIKNILKSILDSNLYIMKYFDIISEEGAFN